LSCFATALLPIHRYANDLRHIGIVYRQYRRLMRHWREVLSLDILDVSYTSLVRHPERTLRNVLEFLDLEWDPACLAYHEHTRITKTASIDQVRRPIYSSSIQRYKRFEKHLGPLKSALGDLADFDDQTQRESTS
jgi:hypothetical protein